MILFDSCCRQLKTGTTKFHEQEIFITNSLWNHENSCQKHSKPIWRTERSCASKKNLLAIKWKDKRNVFVLPIADKAAMVNTANNGNAWRVGGHETVKPAVVVNYNQHKTGVDQADQMTFYYAMYKKSVSWWNVFFGLFTLAIINWNKYRYIKKKHQTSRQDEL